LYALILLGDEDTNSIFTMKNDPNMGLLTPKNDKGDKKAKNKQSAPSQGSKFIKQNSKASGPNKKPIKTGGSRGS
jgi:hypothetical protein